MGAKQVLQSAEYMYSLCHAESSLTNIGCLFLGVKECSTPNRTTHNKTNPNGVCYKLVEFKYFICTLYPVRRDFNKRIGIIKLTSILQQRIQQS